MKCEVYIYSCGVSFHCSVLYIHLLFRQLEQHTKATGPLSIRCRFLQQLLCNCIGNWRTETFKRQKALLKQLDETASAVKKLGGRDQRLVSILLGSPYLSAKFKVSLE